MFFYSAQSRALRRLSIAPQGTEARIGRQIVEVIAKQSATSIVTENEQGRKEQEKDQSDSFDQHRNTIRSSSLANTPCYSTSDMLDKRSNKHYYRRPTVTIQSDGRIIIDHVTTRWDGIPLASQSALLEAEDGATVITETMKEDETQESRNCAKRIGKVLY
uniref:Uncharacterized protein n=1 Tax=Elaeophora elaphi TaxID=1147741 RepID=A0A0R3S2C2_9BILA